MLFWCTDYLRDIKDGHVELNGSVIRKWVREEPYSSQYGGGVDRYHKIQVKGKSGDVRDFDVPEKFYDRLREGDEVVVTYWPRTNTLAGIDILRSPSRSP